MSAERVAVLVLLGGTLGCAIVKSVQVEPDWDLKDRLRLKRLAVITAGPPSGASMPASVQQMWGLMARRYVNQKRDFIVKSDAPAGATAMTALCSSGIEGVLWLEPTLEQKGEGVEAQVSAKLSRCTDGAVAWQAQGAGSWESSDASLTEMTASYAAKLGAGVQPYVAPSFRLLKAVLDTLPNPELNDQDKDEKIALDE